MYLHVQISEEEPIVYALDRDEILIGSNPSSDVYIDRKEISRKHLKIFREGSSYFAIDQGSSNGSYIAGERLIPGKREPFFAASPVRIGNDVYISLAQDLVKGKVRKLQPRSQVAGESSESEKTRVISLKELKAQQAVQSRKKKKKLALRYKRMENLKRKKKDQALIRRSLKIALGFVLLGIVLQKYQSTLTSHVFTETKRSTDLLKKNFVKDIGDISEEKRISREKLPRREVFQELLSDEKCFSRKELSVCRGVSLLLQKNAGVIKATDDYLFFLHSDTDEGEETKFLNNFIKGMKEKFFRLRSPRHFYFITFTRVEEKPTLKNIYAVKASVLLPKLTETEESSSVFSELETDWRIF